LCPAPSLYGVGLGDKVVFIRYQKMKVKNISGERLIEPYFDIVLEPGEVVDLEEPQLSRVLVSYPGKVQLVLEEEEEKEEVSEEKPKGEGPSKKQEVVSEETSE
jgi:hypothetical protein